ncbi:MAG: family 1 glycosylhydrolase [Actinomycetota bacterium]
MELGAVLTATELEGCAPAADWSLWIRRGRAPASDPVAADAFVSGWAEDLDQLVSLGISEVQVTLEWSRLEPHPGAHDVDALEFRRQLMAGARARGLRVWACLVDGTLPGWFADDEGGFIDDRARGLLWPRHIDWIGEHFGDVIDGWIPQREPLHWALRRHLLATAPPGRRDPVAAAEAVRAAVLADGEAWRLLRGTAPVATYQTARPIRSVPDDVKAAPRARALERLLWHPWLSAIGEGLLVVGDLPERQVDDLRGAFDRVIVQLRPTIEVDAAGAWHAHPPEGTVGPTGWVAWPEAMAEVLHRVVDTLGDHEIVAVGDLADVTDDGRARPDHLRAMLDVVDDVGAAGWWQSSPIDGYHWRAGHSLSPGLIDRQRAEHPAAGELKRRRDES